MLGVILSLVLGFACQVFGGPKEGSTNKTERVKLIAAAPIKVVGPGPPELVFESHLVSLIAPAVLPLTVRAAELTDVNVPEATPLVAAAAHVAALPAPIYDGVVFRYDNPGVYAPVLPGLDLSPVFTSTKAPILARLSAEARPTVADPFDSPVPLWKAGYLYGLRKQAVAAKTAGDLEAYASFRLLYLQQLGNILQRHELFVDGAKVRSGGRRQ